MAKRQGDGAAEFKGGGSRHHGIDYDDDDDDDDEDGAGKGVIWDG